MINCLSYSSFFQRRSSYLTY